MTFINATEAIRRSNIPPIQPRFAPTSIWATVEMDAISRDFSYKGYLHLHNLAHMHGVVSSKPVGKSMYYLLWQAFNTQLEEDIGDSAQSNHCPTEAEKVQRAWVRIR